MKPFPLPVVALGAGSQTGRPGFGLYAAAGEVESFIMPALPSSEDVSHLGRAIELIGQLAALAALAARRSVRARAGQTERRRAGAELAG